MKKSSLSWLLSALLIAGLLSACGTRLESDSTTGVTAGVAVDPYIVNAIFEEISADGTRIIQSSSTPSDRRGRFRFANPVQEGSIIRLKASTRGMHGNAPYEGMLKRHIDAGDSGSAVVSPLTTTLANGASEAGLINELQLAGISGLRIADLKNDPMAGLTGATGNLNAAAMHLLQANLAVNTLMMATGNYDYDGTPQGAVDLADCVALSQDLLDANAFNSMAGTISNEIGGTFIFDDMAAAAVEAQRTVVSQIQQDLAGGGSISAARFAELRSNAMTDLMVVAQDIAATRLGTGGATFDAATFFAQHCAGCHNLGTGTSIMTLTNDGDKLNGKFSGGAAHNGNTLAAEEILAMADYLNGTVPVEPPPTPVTGSELYTSECQGCHGSLATSTVSNRTVSGINAAIAANAGGMGSLILTNEQLTLIADALSATAPPPPPTTDRTGVEVYDQECAGCHALGTHDTVGNIDLAGLGNTIITKIEGGHNGKVLSVSELNALADYADTFQPSGPPTGACDSCHGQPPIIGAHATHAALADVGTDCTVCHENAGHNGVIDLAIAATWDAKSGMATSNGSTCANIICHGGQTTPDWLNGSLNPNTQCKSCHEYGTTQYNSYASGQHRRHVVSRGYDCSVCHDAAKLASGHFGNLGTIAFEKSPTTTLKSSLSYANGTCQTPGCHGSQRW